ncbi:MAG: water stress/hypersensitive response domain-containing protein [Desulfobacteraceae bacterium]|nr:MAG: water stress/hypersensitive response domain-containing protein [Desulfobacteraceae bacterium]
MALGSCASLGTGLEPPRVSLADITIQQSSGLETVVLIKLRVVNPNDVMLDVQAVTLDLELNDTPFASGASPSAVSIPAFGSELLSLQAYSSVIHMVRSLIGIHQSGQLTYRAKGRLRLGGMVPPLLPFDASGTFDFSELTKGGKRP